MPICGSELTRDGTAAIPLLKLEELRPLACADADEPVAGVTRSLHDDSIWTNMRKSHKWRCEYASEKCESLFTQQKKTVCLQLTKCCAMSLSTASLQSSWGQLTIEIKKNETRSLHAAALHLKNKKQIETRHNGRRNVHVQTKRFADKTKIRCARNTRQCWQSSSTLYLSSQFQNRRQLGNHLLSYLPPLGFAAAKIDVRAFRVACIPAY